MVLRFIAQVTLCVALIGWIIAPPADAQRRLSFLRDAETEAFIRDVTTPIFLAAELDPDAVNLYLVNDNSINAFVAGGQNIFIHSGLILKASNAEEVIGVMAHETCHISCGHGVRRGQAAKNLAPLNILSLVLGAAAIVAGSPEAGIALLGGGQRVAVGQFLAYTRGEEGEADIQGARYLREAGYSADGLVAFFKKLQRQEVFAQIRQDPYIRSHPLNRQRIAKLDQVVKLNPRHGMPPDPEIEERFQRIKAKLAGYLLKPEEALSLYPPSNIALSARYARVYAYHKMKDWDKALAEANALIEAEANNVYFYEIMGQIEFESGRIKESILTLETAVDLAPTEPLVLTALGQALISLETEDGYNRAIPVLERATRIDRTNTFAWYNLSRAYGFIGDTPRADLATAERYYAFGDPIRAGQYASRALMKLERGTPAWVQAQDILFVARDEAARRR